MPFPSPLHRCVRLMLCLAVASPLSLQAQSGTSTTLTVTPTAPTTAQTLTLTATVTPLAAAMDSNGIRFTLAVPDNPPQTVGFAYPDVNTGVASITLGPLAVSSYTYQATFLSVSNPPPGGQTYGYSSSSPVTVTVTPAGGTNGAALKGQYAFLFQGFTNQQSGNRLGAAAAGSFYADGTGNITSGTLDLNMPEKPSLNLPVTGTYTLATSGRGTVTLKTSLGTQVMAISTPASVNTVESATGTSTGGSLFGTVRIARQAFFAGEINPALELDLAGESAASSPFAVVTGSGQLETGQSSKLILDQTIGFGVTTGLNYGYDGKLAPTDDQGRFTAAFSAADAGTVPQTIDLVGYVIDETHVFLMSTDPHQTSELLSGTAVQ